ncbi:MAG: glycosyltransferase, partial [Steroidobacteraceae bacterium]|nr:glycosyltransferase [Steroidobacteraceae bacterium]MDW8259280.1 glycosyltransferase [Gammaproteobacteria bacterium]
SAPFERRPVHLVDVTLFYSPTSGGVKRYLLAKHAWMQAYSAWRHSILVPGERTVIRPGEVSAVRGAKVPGTFNYRLPLNPRRWIWAIDALEPDIIEVGDAFHTLWAARSVAKRRAIPLIGFYHSNFPQLAGVRLGASVERLLGEYVRLAYEHCDLVCAPSRLMCDYLESIGIRHTVLLPLGVDTVVFSPARRTRDLRRELNLAAKTRLLVYAGRFAGEKNLPVLFDAFAQLGNRYHLLLIGGDRDGRIRRNVTRIAYRRDALELASWIASSDALVHAGTRETFGLVVLEAMACGRPVVAARAGAIPELVDESVGVLADPLSAASMAAAIRALYDRDLEQLGAAARRRVLERFTWQRTFQAQTALYTACLNRAPLPLSGTPAKAAVLAQPET